MIPAGVEPSISALKGLCPCHLDEGTLSEAAFIRSSFIQFILSSAYLCLKAVINNDNLIYVNSEYNCQNHQIIYCWHCCAMLPLVNGLLSVDSDNRRYQQ